MFALKSRIEIASRGLLIAVILFNALIPTSALAKSADKPENPYELPAFIDTVVNHLMANLLPGTPWGYWNLNEDSGTTAYNLGTGANNGTINGTAARVNGRYYDPNSQPSDYALQFNGTNTYVNLPDAFDPTAYTIALWVKPTTINSNIFVRTDSSGPGSSYSHNIYINSNGNFCAYTYDGGLKSVCGTTKVNTTTPTWYHIASTAANNGQLKLYVDGVQEGTPVNLGTLWTGGDRYYIGSNRTSLAYFSGAMDEVKLYTSALSSADILTLYRPDQSTMDITSNPVVANNADIATVNVTLRDADGALLPNHTLTLSASGSGNTITPSSIQTDSNGLATFTLKSTKAETKTLTVFDQTQGINLYSKPTVTFIPGPVNAQKSTVTTNLTKVTSDGTAAATITVTALDDYSNPIQGAEVQVQVTGSVSVTQPSAPTDSLGKATATVKDTVVETVMISAEINSVSVSQSINVRFNCYATGDLTVANGDTCSFSAGSYTYNNLVIQAGGTLILQGNPTLNQGAKLNVASLTIEANGKIDASGLGYPVTAAGVDGSGPGAGKGALGDGGGGAGAGYGGNGQSVLGNHGLALGGLAYGSVTNPTDLGSSGGGGIRDFWGNPDWGGAGGGAIHLNVSGTLTVNGEINADGLAGTAYYAGGGGGSGGSIWIEANSLVGTGSIHANGGAGPAGGGAGGRIAIFYMTKDFTVEQHIYAGGGLGGGPGTVYSKDNSSGSETLLVDNRGNTTTSYAVLPTGSYSYNQIELTRKGVLRLLGTSSSLTFNNQTILGDGTGRLEVEGTIHGPENLILSNATLATLGDIANTTQTINLTGNGNLELYANSPLTSGVYSFADVTVGSGRTLKLVSYDNGNTIYTDDRGVTLNLTNLTVASGGKIDASGLGYPVTAAGVDGSGPGAGKGALGDGGGGAGAGYGGNGQSVLGNHGLALGGLAYGSVTNPTDLGSSGGGGIRDFWGNPDWGGAGGGAIHLNVSGTLTVNGEINADGLAGTAYYAGGGGGSGGSIWIEANSLVGTGSIHANGGGREPIGGSGGGGRIAVYAENSNNTITYSALGGPNYGIAGVGTIYLDSMDLEQSTVTISPDQVVANGTSQALVTVTLLNVDGYPMPNKPVELAVISGSDLSINGQNVEPNQYFSIGNTNANGVVTAILTTKKAGQRAIKAKSGQEFIPQQSSVTFLPGSVSANSSSISVSPTQVPADGESSASITIQARDENDNALPDASVVLQATGSAIVALIDNTTDDQGRAYGSIVDSVDESVTISATINGVDIGDATVIFSGADLSLSMAAPSQALAGKSIQYMVTASNSNSMQVSNVTLEVALPTSVSYTGTSSSITPVQDGQTLTWDLGTLTPGYTTSFNVYGEIASGLEVGTSLNSEAQISPTADGNPANNTASAQTLIVEGHAFNASVLPGNQTLALGASTVYQIKIENTGLLDGQYDLSIHGLDSSWYSLPEGPIFLAPGGTTTIPLTVQVNNSCAAEGDHPFSVDVTNTVNDSTQSLPVNLSLQSGPILSNLLPGNLSTIGSNDVTFAWLTDVPSDGTLTIFREGEPENADTFPTSDSTSHVVHVPGRDFNTTYEWYVKVSSTCGTTTSDHRQLQIGKGIVFVDHDQSVDIDRDYDQRVNITVRNEDDQAHTLTTSVENSYEDVIVNFVEAGSQDQTITLAAGETKSVVLAIHTQDAKSDNYNLTLSLEADDGGTPIYDYASLSAHVLSDGNFSIKEVGAMDPLTLAHTYIITNNGKPITDLALTAIDPDTKEPTKIFLQPSLDHVRLETGQSIQVKAYPLFTAEDMGGLEGSSETKGSARMASVAESSAVINFQVQGTAANHVNFSVPAQTSCGGGKQIQRVQLQNMTCNFATKDWYCTNRPKVSTPVQIPAFLGSANLSSASVQMTFFPNGNVLPHSGAVRFNGHPDPIKSFDNMIPTGQYSFDVPLEYWNNSQAGSVIQSIDLDTIHKNPGHYVSATGFNIQANVNQATTYVCADSPEAGLQVVQQAYGCSASTVFNWMTDVFPGSIYNAGENKTTIAGNPETDANVSNIACSASSGKGGTQQTCGDPINTHTGVFSFTLADLTFPTSAGDLVFQRSYSSGNLGTPGVLGYGWTHNHDARLIFPTDPDGMEGFVLFQSVLGNQYLFKTELDGSFTPGPGVIASLTKTSPAPIIYTLTDAQQAVFEFNEEGRLTFRRNALGHEFKYDYDPQGQLIEVSADHGARSLKIAYEQGRIVSVSDHDDKQIINYTYNEFGDLVSVKDVLGQEWTYAYDSEHHMTQANDPDGIPTVKTEYDLQGRAYRQLDGEGHLIVLIVYNSDGSTTVYDALGHESEHQYDEHNIATQTTDPLGRTEIRTFNDNFRPTAISNSADQTLQMTWSEDGINLLSKTDPAGNTTQYDYDSLNNLTWVKDARGFITTYTYEGKLLKSSKDTLEGETTYSYTPEGYLESVTDPLDRVTSYTYNDYGQRLTMTDPNEKTWHYTYDDLGRLTDTQDPRGRVTHNEYNAAGKLIRVTQNYDPERPQNDENQYNIVTKYEYDVRGNQVAVTDTYEHTTHYIYDDADRLLKTIDPLGNATANAYDAAGQLISTTDPLGNKTTYQYDSTGRLIKTINALSFYSGITTFDVSANTSTVKDMLGRSTVFYYDELGRVIKVVDPLGKSIITTYDENGNVKTRTDQLSRPTQYEYDELNRLIKTINPNGGETETFYDAAGNRIATEDPLNHRTSYTYDDAGRLIATTDPLDRITRTEYDNYGRRSATVDAAGHRMEFTYDALDRVIAVTDDDDHSTYTTYDALGNVISRTDANGKKTYTTYDELNRPLVITDANEHTTINAYDAGGNLISVTDGLEHTTRFTYDKLNRQIAVTDPLEHTTRTSYDELGNLYEKVDANGVVTHYIYDELNRQKAVILNFKDGISADAETNVRYEFTYNAVGNRIAVKDPKGNTTTYGYDALNHVISKSDPLENNWSYIYDLAGNRISATDAKEQTIQYSYDDAGQLIGIDYPGTEPDVTFTYDETGQRIEMTDGLGTTSWMYDDLNRLISVTDAFSQTISYGYDAVGNRTSLTYPDNKKVSYTFDDTNQLVNVKDWEEQNTEYSYDAAGRLSSVSRPNGVTSQYDYDDAGQLVGLYHNLGMQSLASYNYTYDPAGNRTQAIEKLVNPTIPPTATPTSTFTETPTSTATSTNTPTETLTPTATNTATQTSTPTKTATATQTRTNTPTSTAILYTISGNAGVAGATLSYVDGVAKTATADGGGNYSFTVSYNWTGTVTPAKPGYTFSPPSRGYTNVLSNQTGQNYTATPVILTISGNVGVGGATLSYVDAVSKNATADASGNYSFTVSYNWTGTVTPSKVCYIFSPANRSYTNVVSNQPGQNYTAQPCGDTIGIFRPGTTGTFYLKNSNAGGFADIAFGYGGSGVKPVVGDWDGNHTTTIGVFYNGTFNLRNSNNSGGVDISVNFGAPGDQPIAGDWNGDGIDTIGVFRPSTRQFLLRNSNSGGAADISFSFGGTNDVALAGDWNGDGIDTIGVFGPTGVISMRNSNTGGGAEISFNYGASGDKPFTGDWNDDGIDTIGVYRVNTFYLRNSNSVGFADIVFQFGNTGDLPVAGNWDGLPPQMGLMASSNVCIMNSDSSLLDLSMSESSTNLDTLDITSSDCDVYLSQEAALEMGISVESQDDFDGAPIIEQPLESVAPQDAITASPTSPVIDNTPSPTQADSVSSNNGLFKPVGYELPALGYQAEPVFTATSTDPLTIDYTYDDLNRLTGATYSDGRSFGYTYDAAGNVLELQKNLGPGTVVTTYTYDVANQLETATENSVTWQYHYDANGSLIETLPDGNESSGAKRYTYNAAGYLIEVEAHNGASWDVQSEMDYNGLGQRLSMDAAGVIAHYVIDGDQPLTAESSGNTIFYLYGKGIIAEKANDWLYSLPDGLNTPRQLTNVTAEITLAGKYTPWGDILEVHGTGSFTFGYLGGMMDLASGLIYVGNGQYYDPSTGRFLSRGVNSGSTNPYVPWNPVGAIIGPLSLFSLVAIRKRGKHGNGYLLMLFIIVVLPLSIGMACEGGAGITPTEPVHLTATANNGIVTATATVAGQTYTATAPITTPTYGCSIVVPIGPNDTEINSTIKDLADYVFSIGNGIKAISSRANRGDVESYLRRLMEESGRQGLNTNQLAYIYATAHVESGWGDFEEKYEGDPEKYFGDRYGPGSLLGPQLGNTESGDGYRYLGRGFIHLTGRANYLKVSLALGLGTDLVDTPYKAECGKNCPYNYDYVTNIAVTGMKNGLFTGIGLLSPTLSGPDGSFNFFAARPIIGWPGDSSSQQAGDLGVGFSKILSAHCPLGGGSAGIVCVVCP